VLIILFQGEEVRLEDDWVPMDEQLNAEELERSLRQKEAHSRAVVLEMVRILCYISL
jgi:peptidyl-prolyl cis-trans isomerase-like 4